jgi:cephalosporin-C deacetylase-like acetyl esterase
MRLAPAALCALALIAGCGGDDGVDEPPAPPAVPDSFSYDRSRPLDATVRRLGGELGRKARASGISVDDVTFAAADGERVPALFARPPRERRPYPCVIFENGLTSRKEQAAFLWAPFAGIGVGTFTIDLRYHGERATRRVNAESAAKSPSLLPKMVRGTVLDFRRALDYLETRRDCDPDRLGFVGVSLTGITGAILAGVDKRVKAPALLVGGANWAEIVRGESFLLDGVEEDPDRGRLRRALRRLARLDPAEYAGHISPRTVLMVNGREDATIRPAAARALHAAAREPKTVSWYEGGHNVFFGVAGEDVTAQVLSWLERELVDPPVTE